MINYEFRPRPPARQPGGIRRPPSPAAPRGCLTVYYILLYYIIYYYTMLCTMLYTMLYYATLYHLSSGHKCVTT